MTGQFFADLYTFFNGDGYVFELMAAVAVFSWKMRHRRFFVGRALGVAAVFVLFSLGYNALGFDSICMVCLKTVLLVLLSIPGVCFCFEAGVMRAVFTVTAAAAAQHLSFKVGQTAASLARLAGVRGENLTVYIYMAGFGAALGLCWLLFARRLGRIEHPRSSLTSLSLLLGVQLTTNLMQNLFLLSNELAGSVLYYVFQLYGMLVCLFILGLQFEMGSRQAAQEDNVLLNQLIYQQKQQLAVRREVIGVINARCHELKQQTAALRGLIPPEQLEALNQAVDAYDTAVDTGSEPLNVLLAEKRLLCKSKQIAFDCMAEGKALGFLRTSDLYALLGNLLDNAVTAAARVKSSRERYIRLEVARRHQMVVVHCENSCVPEDLPDFRDGMPVASFRSGGSASGWGMETIQTIAERYGGFCRASAAGGVFAINLLFPGQGDVQLNAKK